jgi:type II secretory pathway pseudopilin PulG
VRASEAGFSLIEILIAAGLFVVVSFGALEAVRQLLAATQHLASRHLAYESVERLSAQLRAEARSATSIAVPAVPSSGRDTCVQVDFYTADAAGPHFWSYRTFPNHAPSDPIPGDALERLAGSSPIAPCDPAQHGAIVGRSVRTFTATTVTAASLTTHADPYLGGVTRDSPFAGPTVADASVSLGVRDAVGAPVSGGNALVEVRIANDDVARLVDLVVGVFPTGYTLQLVYSCDDRCTVGHDTGAPKTITSCTMTAWQEAWSRVASYTPVLRSDGSGIYDLVPSYWVAGYFVFTYSGTARNGANDTIAHVVLATNDGQSPPDGTHGTAAPFDASPSVGSPGATLSAWYNRFLPYVDDAGPYNGSSSGVAGLQQEAQRCANVDAEGRAGGYSFD